MAHSGSTCGPSDRGGDVWHTRVSIGGMLGRFFSLWLPHPRMDVRFIACENTEVAKEIVSATTSMGASVHLRVGTHCIAALEEGLRYHARKVRVWAPNDYLRSLFVSQFQRVACELWIAQLSKDAVEAGFPGGDMPSVPEAEPEGTKRKPLKREPKKSARAPALKPPRTKATTPKGTVGARKKTKEGEAEDRGKPNHGKGRALTEEMKARLK